MGGDNYQNPILVGLKVFLQGVNVERVCFLFTKLIKDLTDLGQP